MVVMIEVTGRDIARGTPGEPCLCPIALAINRLLNRKYECVMFCLSLQIRRRSNHERTDVDDIPDEASTFVCNLDEGVPVKPLSFFLDIPGQFLKTTK